MRAKKLCSHYDCPNQQPCELHQRKPWQGSTRKERSKLSSHRQQKRRRYLLRRDNLTCAICGRLVFVGLRSGSRGGPLALEQELEVDHIKPLAEGGADVLKNCQLACLECHSEKTQAEAQRGRLVDP